MEERKMFWSTLRCVVEENALIAPINPNHAFLALSTAVHQIAGNPLSEEALKKYSYEKWFDKLAERTRRIIIAADDSVPYRMRCALVAWSGIETYHDELSDDVVMLGKFPTLWRLVMGQGVVLKHHPQVRVLDQDTVADFERAVIPKKAERRSRRRVARSIAHQFRKDLDWIVELLELSLPTVLIPKMTYRKIPLPPKMRGSVLFS